MTGEPNAGWGFRTSHPVFEEGETLVVHAGPYDKEREGLIVRIGDTKLHVTGTTPEMADDVVEITVTRFDTDRHEGEAELVEVRDRTGF